jgi:tripartite ATP-independent transporter DctM subunit
VTIALLFVSFGVLLLIGVPIVWCMAVACLVAVVFGGVHMPWAWFAQQVLRGADSISLSAIPLFLLAGELMNRGGLTPRIMRVAEHLFGRIRGGLGLVNVATAFVYGGISGSATADTAAVATLMIPAMEARGYPRSFSAAVTAAAGTLGIIVPPSVVFILYGVLTSTSIGGLFVAGIIPGAALALSFMVAAYVVGRREGFPRADQPFSAGAFLRDLVAAAPALLMPVVVLGVIIGGITTATEAAAVSVIYAFLVGVFVYRELPWRELFPAAVETVTTTGSIMMIMAVATPFAWILTIEQVPLHATAWITSATASNAGTVVLVLLLLAFVGLWLDLGPALIILAPILHPVLLKAGLGVYQTGILFSVMLGIGLFTPPVGTNIFVVCNVAKIDMGSVSRRLVPFWIASVVAVAALALFPPLTEWLPKHLGF